MSIFSRKKKVQDIDRGKPDWTFEGHNFYLLNPHTDDETNPYKLSTERALNYLLAFDNLGLQLKPDEIDRLMGKLIEMAMEKRNSEIVSLCDLTRERLKLKSNIELYLDLGRCMVLIDDEPNEKPNNKYSLLREELLKNDQVQGFFFRAVTRCLNLLQPSLNPTNAEDYSLSQEAREIEKIFQSKI